MGVLGIERTKVLAKRLYEYRQKELVHELAKEKLAVWKNIAGANPEERKKTFQDYNKKKYLKLFSAAISSNNYPEIQRLIELGCDPNFETKGNHTALNQAATFNKIELTKWLVQHGVDVMDKPPGHTTFNCIHVWLHGNDTNLIELGADVNMEQATGQHH